MSLRRESCISPQFPRLIASFTRPDENCCHRGGMKDRLKQKHQQALGWLPEYTEVNLRRDSSVHLESCLDVGCVPSFEGFRFKDQGFEFLGRGLARASKTRRRGFNFNK